MNTGKQNYKEWLDELSTTPSEAFFKTFRQFLDLLLKENPEKIALIRKEVDVGTRELIEASNKAIAELEPLLLEVEKQANKQKITDLGEIQQYKDIKSGLVKVIGENLPDTLYHAIRLTIEKYRSTGQMKAFDVRLLSERDGFWYLDYDKACTVYPEYKNYKDAQQSYDQKYENEPWGAYLYLHWATTFFKNTTPEQAGSFVKPEIINRLRQLILYMLTPEETQNNNANATEKPIYWITYSSNRNLMLNDVLRLARPDLDSENDIVFDYLYKNPNKKISLSEIESATKNKVGKTLHKVVENLGFKGELKEAFFQVSKDCIYFRNPITQSYLDDIGISRIKLS